MRREPDRRLQAQRQGVTPARRGALDGTSIAADAGRRRLVNEATLLRRREQLEQALQGQTPLPPWIAPTPRGRPRQRARLQQAQQIMAERQARNGQTRAGKRQATDRIVLRVTDPEAPVSSDKEGVFRPLYNGQVFDDLDSPLVLAYDVFAQPNDAGLLGPMLHRAEQLLGHRLETVLTDTAYAGGADWAVAEAAGVTLYAPLPANPKAGAGRLPKSAFVWLAEAQTYECPQGHRLVCHRSKRHKRSGTEKVLLHEYRCPAEYCQRCPLQGACTPAPQRGRTISRSEHEEKIQALRERMRTAEGKELYRQRGQTVEWVNADGKGHRKRRRFTGRGLRRVRCQAGLQVLTDNLLTWMAKQQEAPKELSGAA